MVAAEFVDDHLDGRRIVEVAAGGGLRQQQVVAHHAGQQGDVRRPQPEPGPDLTRQFRADDAVVPAASLADVVQERTEHQQVGT